LEGAKRFSKYLPKKPPEVYSHQPKLRIFSTVNMPFAYINRKSP
jgi:hypothetical protein